MNARESVSAKAQPVQASREAHDDAGRVLLVLLCAMHLMCGMLCRVNDLGAEGAKALAPTLGLLTSLGTLSLG
jgi:hypothetical protein